MKLYFLDDLFEIGGGGGSGGDAGGVGVTNQNFTVLMSSIPLFFFKGIYCI